MVIFRSLPWGMCWMLTMFLSFLHYLRDREHEKSLHALYQYHWELLNLPVGLRGEPREPLRTGYCLSSLYPSQPGWSLTIIPGSDHWHRKVSLLTLLASGTLTYPSETWLWQFYKPYLSLDLDWRGQHLSSIKKKQRKPSTKNSVQNHG